MIRTKQEGNTLYHQGAPCLVFTIELPYLSGATYLSHHFNHFYQKIEQLWKNYWTEVLHANISQHWNQITPWTAHLDYTVHLDTDTFLSLTLTVTERWNGQWHSLRISDTWDVQRGYPLALTHFYPSGLRQRAGLIQQILHQATAYVATGESLFYEDYQQRLHRHFDPQAFYVAEDGLHLYYPIGTIGSQGEGFPDFLISRENLSLKYSA